MKLNVNQVRGDFPILERKIRDRRLIYLDNAASTLKPNRVIERIANYYRNETSNVHRGAHFLASEGTIAFESARSTVAQFLNATSSEQIIFTRGTTESVNLVAESWGRSQFKAGDEIILTELEHHSNIVPWQLIAERTGAVIRVVKINAQGELDFDQFTSLLNPRTKMLSMTWCSNVLGTINDVEKYIEAAHRVGAKVFIDAAQAAPQFVIDVQKINCDFLAFSGHKVFGPYGIGVLYGKSELLEMMPPYQGGGSMIAEVTWEKTTWAAVPHKFEAGTPEISGAVGLEASLRYMMDLGFDAIVQHERDLLHYAEKSLAEVPGLHLLGGAKDRAGIVSFTMDGAHPSDVGSILDQQGVAIRTGHHCCQPLMRALGVPATARASFSIYNTHEEVDVLKASLIKAKEFF